MELNNYKKKFKDLFDKFFKENFEFDNYYSENLVKYLRDNNDKRAENVLQTPFFSDLLLYSLTNLENASNSVRKFISEVLKIILSNELQCSKIMSLQGMELIHTKLYMSSAQSDMPIYLHATGIDLVTTMITHSTGMNLCIQKKLWTKMFYPGIHAKPAMVARSTYNFMSTLVWKLDEYAEEAILIEVLSYIFDPIKNNNYHLFKTVEAENEKVIYESILSHLHCFLTILGETDKIVHTNKVITLLNRYIFLDSALSMILDVTRDPEFMCLIGDILFRLFIGSTIRYSSTSTDRTEEVPLEYCNIANHILQKRMPIAVVHFTVNCYTFWAKLDKDIVAQTFQRYGRTYHVQDQLIMMILMPILVHSYYVNRMNPAITEMLEYYHHKLKSMSTEHVVKALYMFRYLLENGNAKTSVIESLKQLFRIKHYLNEKQAGIVYQALYYVLQYFVVSDAHGALTERENPTTSPDDIKMISLVLDLTKGLLKEHNIRWYENLEIISLQNCLMNLVKQNLLPKKQLIQAVDLINLSIRKFLSPDLALLTESRQGSTLNSIGSLLKFLVEYDDWELKDSALQLLLSCTELAYVKYIPLQKLLMENELIGLAAQRAVNDEEYYVQMTALRCIAAASKIDCLWKQALTAQPNLHCEVIYILQYHSEGIVRKEAANVLLKLYDHHKISAESTECLYNIMTTAAVKDLHWEVQIAALKFWEVTIKYQLSNRGMIDGKFPSVTFCKRLRKIIMLNDKVIKNQITEIMNYLASCGCLIVLDKCLNEEHHIDVIELAHSIAKDLMAILDYYKFDKVPEDTIVPQLEEDVEQTKEIEEMFMDLSFEALFTRQQIAEEIANTSQIDLIENLHNTYTYTNAGSLEDMGNRSTTKTHRWMDPNEFMRKFSAKNYLHLIESKKNWNSGPNNLDALLDEVLTLGEVKKDLVEECD